MAGAPVQAPTYVPLRALNNALEQRIVVHLLRIIGQRIGERERKEIASDVVESKRRWCGMQSTCEPDPRSATVLWALRGSHGHARTI